MVPPRRLGALLHDARVAEGRSIGELCVGSRFGEDDLDAVEAGSRVLGDSEIEELVRLYGIDPGELVPERGHLVIDLREHQVVAGGTARVIAGEAPTPDEVLASYLSLVYTLRRAEPGTPLTLRDGDVAVLARALELAVPTVEHRLHDLMAEPDGQVQHRMGVLRHRFLVPVAGVVVAATAVGAIVFVQTRSDDGDAKVPATIEAPAGDATGAGAPDVKLAPPQVAVRNPDGSVSQAERQPDPNAPLPSDPVIIQEGLPASALAPGQVGLAPAQVAVRNPDGSVTQTERAGEPSSGSTSTTTTTGP